MRKTLSLLLVALLLVGAAFAEAPAPVSDTSEPIGLNRFFENYMGFLRTSYKSFRISKDPPADMGAMMEEFHLIVEAGKVKGTEIPISMERVLGEGANEYGHRYHSLLASFMIEDHTGWQWADFSKVVGEHLVALVSRTIVDPLPLLPPYVMYYGTRADGSPALMIMAQD